MGKIQIKNYSFNKTAKTVTFTDYASIDLDSVLLITNVTTNVIIYRFNDSTKGGTVATNVLTLTYDTSSMSNTDKLQIFYDDVNYNDGSKADAEASSNTGTFSLIALFKRLLNTVLTGGSQKSQVVDGSGNVISSTGNALDINIKAGNISGFATEGTLDARTGSLTEAAPATDTASSGLNGRLQRIAQRITTLISSILTVKTDQTTHGTTDLVASDVTKVAGTAVDVNSGNKSAGTQRVVIATDQPKFTAPLNFDVSQINGVTPLMGNGTTGTGSPRVTVASDNTPFGIKVNDGSANAITSRTVGSGGARHLDTAAANGDLYITGQGSQTALNNNILLATQGTGWLDTLGFKSMLLEIIVASGTVTAGAITFEQANDPNASTQTFPLNGQTLNIYTASVVNTLALSASPGYNALEFELKLRYVRAKISTGVTGTTTGIQAFTTLSPQRSANVQSVRSQLANDFITSTVADGSVGHDGVDSSSNFPVKVGARAITSLKTATLVSSGDRTDNQSDLDGAVIVRDQFPLGDLLSERITDTGGSSTAFTNFSAVASTKNYITSIVVYNSSATAGTVDFRDGASGSVLWTMPVPAGSGSILSAGAFPYFKTSANTALAYDVSAALTTVSISISGFQSKL